MSVKKKYNNKFNRTQIVEVVKDFGYYTLVKSEKGITFFAITKGLKNI